MFSAKFSLEFWSFLIPGDPCPGNDLLKALD